MMDFHLAELYEVETKALKQAVKRNRYRFPDDFMFQLTKTEFESLRSQIVTSNRGGTRYMPYAFTEQGVAMISSILQSRKAIEVNIAIMRAFVLIRQYHMDYKQLKRHIEKLEKEMHRQFKDIYQALDYLLNPPVPKNKRIGFKINEDK